MALTNVKFEIGQGGLARQLPSKDHVSCLVFDNVVAPVGFVSPSVAPLRPFLSLSQIEDAGIVETGLYGDVWYQAKEFWRLHQSGKLWIAFQGVSPSQMVNITGGEIRQYAKVLSSYSRAAVNTEQDFLNTLASQSAPAVMVLGAPIADFSLLQVADYPRNMENSGCTVVVAGDGDNQGAALADALGIPCVLAVGAVLGAYSSGQVHESIAWVAEYNFARTELEKPVFSDGSFLEDLNPSDLDQLDDYGFVFFRKFVGRFGSYVNASHAATILNSDYAFIENSRAIQKAIREVKIRLLPQLASPLYLAPDGNLRADTVASFIAFASVGLIDMQNAGELSGFVVEIDPMQNVLATGELEIKLRLQPVGVARDILVKIELTAQLNS